MRTKHVCRMQWITQTASILLIGWMCAILAAPALAANGVSSEAGPEGIAQTAYSPDNGPGPVVILISGANGPAQYQPYAAEVAKLGYYSVLVAGKDILLQKTGPIILRKTIERALQSPNAVKGKAAVIGFSLGGGAALRDAANKPNLVSMVVAYYPFTKTWANNVEPLVSQFKVPMLVLAAQRDHYEDCCLIGTAQAIEASAKTKGTNLELVVYPEADHGFNLKIGANGKPWHAYRENDAGDAWRRTVDMLKLYHPLPK